jgi:hypothetical protein
MAIAFPTTFATQSGNVAASTLDANFTYTGTLPSQATTITSGGYTLNGSETILINAGSTPYGCTLQQFSSALGVGTATKLATPRTISTTGDVTYTSAAFDGTSNVSGTATVVSASTSTAGKVQLAQASDVLLGSSAILAMTPAAFSGNASVATSGYYKLPSGLVLVWGYTAYAGATTNISISAIVTLTSVYSISLTGSISSLTQAVGVSSVTASGFVATAQNTIAGYYWMVIGK